MPEIMTTKEMATYLKLHEITITKYAAEGEIPAIRIGRVWRFDKEAVDKWISEGQKRPRSVNKVKATAVARTGKTAAPRSKRSTRK